MGTYTEPSEAEEVIEVIETTFGLERDLQIALRSNIEQLEQGLLRCSMTPVVWQSHPYLSTTLTTPILRFITHNLTGLSFYLFLTLTFFFSTTTFFFFYTTTRED